MASEQTNKVAQKLSADDIKLIHEETQSFFGYEALSKALRTVMETEPHWRDDIVLQDKEGGIAGVIIKPDDYIYLLNIFNEGEEEFLKNLTKEDLDVENGKTLEQLEEFLNDKE